MSVASEITRLQGAKASLKTSINAKTDAQHQIANETLEDYADFVDSIQTGGGGGGLEEKDVNFYDYDGTLVDSYSKNDFLVLSAMPENPTHEGLTAQGWNWSLSNAKTYVTKYGYLEIGQLYITDDKKTKIHITLTDEILNLYLGIAPVGNVVVNWGDGSPEETISGQSTSIIKNTLHTYSAAGDYVITLAPESILGILGSTYSQLIWTTNRNQSGAHRNAIKKIFLGEKVKVRGYAFVQLNALETLSVASDTAWDGNQMFMNCTKLKALVMNQSMEGGSLLTNMSYSLKKLILPAGFTNFNSAENTGLLKTLCLPQGMTSTPSFVNSMLEKVILPDSITTISGNTFSGCKILKDINLPTSITSIGDSAFMSCSLLEDLVFPSNITSLGSQTFNGCTLLSKLNLPASLTQIKSYCFAGCSGIKKVIFPSGVTSIENYAFNNCYSCVLYDFRNANSVPTLGGTYSFGNINPNCKIVVPDNLYDTWIAANNWSSLASYIVKASLYS